MTDANLINLGRELNARISSFQRARAKAGRKWSNERLDMELAKFADLESAIEKTPASSLAELKVKAALAAWQGGGHVTGATIESKLAASIIRDVLEMRAHPRSDLLRNFSMIGSIDHH